MVPGTTLGRSWGRKQEGILRRGVEEDVVTGRMARFLVHPFIHHFIASTVVLHPTLTPRKEVGISVSHLHQSTSLNLLSFQS